MPDNWVNWLALVQTVLMLPSTIVTLRALIRTIERHVRKQGKKQM